MGSESEDPSIVILDILPVDEPDDLSQQCAVLQGTFRILIIYKNVSRVSMFFFGILNRLLEQHRQFPAYKLYINAGLHLTEPDQTIPFLLKKPVGLKGEKRREYQISLSPASDG